MIRESCTSYTPGFCYHAAIPLREAEYHVARFLVGGNRLCFRRLVGISIQLSAWCDHRAWQISHDGNHHFLDGPARRGGAWHNGARAHVSDDCVSTSDLSELLHDQLPANEDMTCSENKSTAAGGQLSGRPRATIRKAQREQ